jgi:hypothetical protein
MIQKPCDTTLDHLKLVLEKVQSQEWVTNSILIDIVIIVRVIPNSKDEIRYAPYVSLRGQISHIATKRGNIKRQCINYITYIINQR